MSEEAIAKRYAKPLPTVPPSERRERIPEHRRRPVGQPETPESRAFLIQNARNMTSTDLAFALGCSEPEIRKRCRELGLAWKSGQGGPLPKSADPDHEPTHRELESLPGLAGSRIRVQKLRELADKGCELFERDDRDDMHESLRNATQGRVETPKLEPIL